MTTARLIAYLQTLPENTEVYTQTTNGDYLELLRIEKLSVSAVQGPTDPTFRLCITALLKGGAR